MVKKKAYFLDADYIIKNEETYVRVTVKGKTTRRLFYRYDPYFYVEAPSEKKEDLLKLHAPRKDGTDAVPLRVEEVERWLKGKKKKLLKFYCRVPPDVPVLQPLVAYPCYEYRIPFARRWMLDMQLAPFDIITYEREGPLLKKILQKEPGHPKLRALAFDIETYNPMGTPRENKDPIIMLSYASAKRSGVVTYKPSAEKYVEVLDSEKAMLQRLGEVVHEENPDVLFGYNSANFDLPYLEARARQCRMDLRLGRWSSRLKKVRKGLASSIKLDGRIHVDLYPAVRFFGFIGVIKAQRFGLDDVAQEVLGQKKVSIQKGDMWKMWDDGNLQTLVPYSHTDAKITYALGEMLLPLQMELAVLSKLPLFDITIGSSGQLVENLLMHAAVAKEVIVPTRPSDAEVHERTRNPIQGAYVKLPEPGIYDNIAVMDFRGLYPSIIVSYNIDPDRLVPEAAEKDCHLSPTGAKFLKSPPGLIPEVVDFLVEFRTKLKQQLKKLNKDSEEYRVVSARSQSCKILTNSVYGYSGYPRARWYNRSCAESTTAYGRKHIMETIEKAERAGFTVLYGDSITADRFVTVMNSQGIVQIQNVEEFFESHKEKASRCGKKEIIGLNGYKALTTDPKTMEGEWRNITEIIRHKTPKKIYRVSQKYGETRVTEDHSIMVWQGGMLKEAKPIDMMGCRFAKVTRIPAIKQIEAVDVYEYLRHFKYKTMYKGREKTIEAKADSEYVWFNWTRRKKPVKVKRHIKVGTPEFESLCRLLGAYIPEGSSSTPETTASRWGASIASSNINWLEELKTHYERLFDGIETCIIPSNPKPRDLNYAVGGQMRFVHYQDTTHKLQMMNQLAAVFFKAFCGQKSTAKKLPDFVFHIPQETQELFLDEMITGDGSRSVNKQLGYSRQYIEKNFKYTTRSLAVVSGLSFLLAQLNRNYYITYRPAKKVYTLGTSDRSNARYKTKLIAEKYDGYVYDLSVEDNHMFVDSCGQVLLHNTDSIFLLHKNREDVLQFLEKINAELPGKMELELEGFYPRGVFVSRKGVERGAKKKYALLGEDGRIKIRGFELVRRDWSKVAKETQRGVLEAILKEGSQENAVAIVRETIERLRQGNVPLEELAIVTQLNKAPGSYEIMSPELSAASKGAKRGVPMEKGTPISYVITKTGKSISDKAEMLEFAKDYDVNYYINHQVLPSVMKILKELGYDEYDLKVGGKQKGLGDFF